jgi:hypothetical protein
VAGDRSASTPWRRLTCTCACTCTCTADERHAAERRPPRWLHGVSSASRREGRLKGRHVRTMLRHARRLLPVCWSCPTAPATPCIVCCTKPMSGTGGSSHRSSASALHLFAEQELQRGRGRTHGGMLILDPMPHTAVPMRMYLPTPPLLVSCWGSASSAPLSSTAPVAGMFSSPPSRQRGA